MMRTSAPCRGYTFFAGSGDARGDEPHARGRRLASRASARGSVRRLLSTTIAVDHMSLQIAPGWDLLLVGLRTGASSSKATVRNLEFQERTLPRGPQQRCA